jgi:hypothetical protein
MSGTVYLLHFDRPLHHAQHYLGFTDLELDERIARHRAGHVAGQLEALLRRNAEACENAKGPVCDCACGGKYHGKAHSTQWIREQVAELEKAQSAERGEFNLFDW